MALDLGISLKVETSSLEEAMKKVNALGDAVSKVGKEIKSSVTGTSKATQESNKAIERSASATERSSKKVTSVLERQRLIAQFLAGDFTKGEASILATGKAAGLTNKQMKELESTLKQIFKLSGKNPFDDSVDPLRRLTAESEKLVNKMKVLRGETTLTAKQLEELTIRQARVEASARAQGLRGAALQSTINKATKEYISLAEKVNSQQAKYNLELENTKNNRKAEESVLRGISTGISGAIKQQEKLKKLVEETELKSRLMQQGLSTTTANMVVRAVRGGASVDGSEVQSLIASRKAIESVNEAKKKLAETSSATYQAIVEGNKKAKFHIDGLQAAVRAVIPGFGALSAVAIGSTVIAGAIRMADAYRGLQERLKLVTSSEEERISVSRRLLEISNANFQSLKETTELYVKLRPALAAVGGTQQQTLAVTDAFSKSLALSGANTREAAAATLQFAQAMGSGKLAGDEFRSISEAAPAVLQAIAAGTGKTTGELKKLASEGFLTTATVSKALLSQLTAIEIKFGILQPTISQSFNVLKNNTTDLIAQLDKATGFTNGIANSFLSIGNALGQVVPSIQSFGKVLSENSQFLSEAVIGITAYILVTQRAAIVYGTYKALLVTGIALEKSIIAVTAAKTAAIGAMTIATTTYTLAGKGFVGVLAVMAQGIGALTAALIRNPFMLIATGLAAIGAFLAGDKIEKFFAGMGEKFSNFGTKVEEGAVKLEDGAKVLEKLQKELSLVQGGMSPEQAKLNLTSEQAITEEYKQRIEIANQFKGKDQERYIALLKEATLIKKSREDLQKLRTGENIKDPKVQTVESFNLGRINQEIEARLQGEKKTFDFRRDLIDKNLQYDLITAGVAEIQKQRLAEETYKKERALLQENINAVNAVKNTGRSKEEQEEQEKQRKSRVEVLETQIKTLDIDRQRTLEIAKVVALGESEKKALEARRDIAKIEADIREDINRKQQEFNNRFADPAVLAAEQARLQAADKYTQKIAEAQQVIQRIKTLQDNQALVDPEDAKTTSEIANELSRMEEILKRLIGDQKRFGDEAANSAKNIVEQSRSLEEGFKRAFKTFRDEQSDLSKISENFTRGFFEEFDKAFINIFKSGKIQFGNLFKFIREEIKKLFIQQVLLNPIKLALEGIFSQISKALIVGIKSIGTSLVSSVGSAVSGALNFNIAGAAGNAAISATSSIPLLNTAVSQTIGFISKANASITASSQGLGKSLNLMVDDFANYLTTTNSQVLQNLGMQIQNAQTGTSAASGAGSVAGAIGSFAGVYVGNKVSDKISGGRTIGGFGGTLNSLVTTASAAIGTAIGAALGSVVPVIGTKIGAALGGFLGGIAGGITAGIQRQLFGKKVTQTAGIEGTISSEGFTGQNFVETVTKRRFRSTKVDTQYSALEQQYESTLDAAIALTFQSSRELIKLLGAGSEEAINNYTESGRFFIRNTEELQSTLVRLSNTLLDKAVPSLKSFQREGETLAQTAIRVANTISGLNNLTQLIGNASKFTFETFSSGENLVKSLQNEDFQRALDFYVQNFADKADVFKAKSDAFNFQVQQLGLSLETLSASSSKEQFSSLIKSLDLTSEGGQQLLGSLLSLSPALKEIVDLREQESKALEDQKKAVLEQRLQLQEELFNLTATQEEILNKQRQALDESNRVIFDEIQLIKKRNAVLEERKTLEEEFFNLTATPQELLNKQREALDESNRSLFDQIQLIKKKKETEEKAIQDITEAYNREKDAVTQVRDKLKGFADTLADYRNELLSSSGTLTGQQQLDVARSRFESTVQALGSSDQAVRDKAFGDFTNVSNAFLEASREFSGTYVDYLNDFSRVSAVLSQTEQQLLSDISVQEQQLSSLKDMVSGIISVDESVKNLSETLRFYFTGTAADIGSVSPSVTPLNISAPMIQQSQVNNSIMENQLSILNSKVQQLIEENRVNAQTIAVNTGKTAKILERADDGDAINVRVVVD